ncbi:hypothetical protein RDI58_028392 [Solanum bulbocastanum]|uniref:Uncharacterized protein n=1 Tax=Solanum bulbocastanum TaxID=147425 RepID=A0AAN8XYW7_SOLBU
MTPRAAFFHK